MDGNNCHLYHVATCKIWLLCSVIAWCQDNLSSGLWFICYLLGNIIWALKESVQRYIATGLQGIIINPFFRKWYEKIRLVNKENWKASKCHFKIKLKTKSKTRLLILNQMYNYNHSKQLCVGELSMIYVYCNPRK